MAITRLDLKKDMGKVICLFYVEYFFDRINRIYWIEQTDNEYFPDPNPVNLVNPVKFSNSFG